MDGRSSNDFGSYFNTTQYHLHVIDDAASSATAAKEIFPAPFSSAAVDVNPFSIPHAVSVLSSLARPAAAATIAAEAAKRKRGRPRKYGARPSLPSLSLPTSAMSAAARASPSLLRPSPLSSSKKKEATSSNSSARKAQLTALGNAGQGFTPHVIAVSPGEDLVNKVASMMKQGKRAVCVLSATGSILNPSLRQPASSSANATYEGMFDIISLSGALTYTEAGGTVSRTGGLGVCLSGVDGCIVGGGVEGPLMAAGPVQVIAGSFLIDINKDFNAFTKEDDYTNKLSTEAATCATLALPISMESTFGSSRRMTSSRGSDDYQSMGGGFHLVHSRPMFPSPDWNGMCFLSSSLLEYIMLPLCTLHTSLINQSPNKKASTSPAGRGRAGTLVELPEYANLQMMKIVRTKVVVFVFLHPFKVHKFDFAQ